MAPLSIPLRVAVLQFSPKTGQVEANVARARELCQKLKPNTIDLLCLPEMTFSGYVFDSAEHIKPYLEHPHTGPTSQFCKWAAERLGCYVAAGYPERLSADEDHPQTLASSNTIPSMGKLGIEQPAPGVAAEDLAADHPLKLPAKGSSITVGANSAVIYGPTGNRVVNYRKTNLFETDMTWAKPGTGFASFTLNLPPSTALSVDTNAQEPPTTVPVSLGICMDLNRQPQPDGSGWTLEYGPYELADHSLKHNSRILILLNAWLDPDADQDGEITEKEAEEEEEVEEEDEDDPQPAWSTLEFWSARLRPLWVVDKHRRKESDESIWSNGTASSGGQPGEVQEEKPPHETIVVVCNRTGKENGKTFAGSSALFSMKAGSGKPKLLDVFGRREEGIRVWNLLI